MRLAQPRTRRRRRPPARSRATAATSTSAPGEDEWSRARFIATPASTPAASVDDIRPDAVDEHKAGDECEDAPLRCDSAAEDATKGGQLESKGSAQAAHTTTPCASADPTLDDEGDDLDAWATEWKEAQKQGAGWGGRSRGGRGVRIRTGRERDIVIEGTTLAYDGVTLLRPTTLRLVSGRVYGLIGQNGCGKSTLLRRIGRHAVPGFPTSMTCSYVDQKLSRWRLQSACALDTVIDHVWGGADKSGAERYHALREEQSALEEADADESNVERLCQIEEELASLASVLGGGEDGGLHANRAEQEKLARACLVDFGFSQDLMMLTPVKNLSGGWRMRLELAVAFLRKPGCLLLDEPTNHLDLEAVAWLAELLRRRGTNRRRSAGAGIGLPTSTIVLIVSHDRSFLDSVVEEIIHFSDMTLQYHSGNYSDFARAQEEQRRFKGRLLEVRRRKEAAAAKAFKKQTQSQSLKRTRKGFDPKKEKQAASRLKKAKERAGFYRSDGKRFKQHSLKTMCADSMLLPEVVTEDDVRDKSLSLAFRLPEVSKASLRLAHEDAPVLCLDEASVGYGTKPVLASLTASCSLQSRVGLVGANGSGKTTLLKLMRGTLHPSNGSAWVHRNLRVAVLAQHHVDELSHLGEKSPVQILQERGSHQLTDLKARNLLGTFGLRGDLTLQPSETLSGGQLARLALAIACSAKPHLLMLDEPTNHLDMQSIDALIDALQQFGGGLVVVSHDQYFISQVCRDLWILRDGGLRTIPCADGEGFKDELRKYVRSVS